MWTDTISAKASPAPAIWCFCAITRTPDHGAADSCPDLDCAAGALPETHAGGGAAAAGAVAGNRGACAMGGNPHRIVAGAVADEHRIRAAGLPGRPAAAGAH